MEHQYPTLYSQSQGINMEKRQKILRARGSRHLCKTVLIRHDGTVAHMTSQQPWLHAQEPNMTAIISVWMGKELMKSHLYLIIHWQLMAGWVQSVLFRDDAATKPHSPNWSHWLFKKGMKLTILKTSLLSRKKIWLIISAWAWIKPEIKIKWDYMTQLAPNIIIL